MMKAPIPRKTIATERLVLRPSTIEDAGRAFEIQSDWDVARMLRMAAFPPDRQEMRTWFAEHRREWLEGKAFRFAVNLDGVTIGVADLDDVKQGCGDLGYWFEQRVWGRGYAVEAAHAVVRFAFEEVGLTKLIAGHAADNIASGKVLARLGFKKLNAVEVTSRSRGGTILQYRYALLAN
jgi:RimJ/RimL family protein N-acetyltransferase